MFKNKACMYLRQSKDDGMSSESNSITNQRELILSYVKNNEMEIVKEYVDDGYSGTNYDRPALKNLMEEISKKKAFDIIIVKDLSRFGRDYIGAGTYIQKIFPQLHIRFISINDNYDSKNADMSDTNLILPIRNFINRPGCPDPAPPPASFAFPVRRRGGVVVFFGGDGGAAGGAHEVDICWGRG